MKKLLGLLLLCFLLVGCDFVDDFSDRYLYTTSYPIEYAADVLYGEYATVASVYPNGANETYEVTDKKKEKYATAETFIYSGISGEASLARDILNKNSKLKLIDATKGIKSTDSFTSVWLNPSNYLMLCSNIKSSLIDYTDNIYVKEAIEENYKKLNEQVSELDVELYDIGKNGNYNTLLATSDVFNYLSKYNINVIAINSDNEQIDKSYSDAKKLIADKKIQYIYILSGQTLDENQEKLIAENNLIKVEINDLFTLTDEERTAGSNYISLMKETIENYKKELYK